MESFSCSAFFRNFGRLFALLMNQDVPKDYFEQVSDAAYKFALMRSGLQHNNAFNNNVRIFVSRLADTTANEISFLMCLDALRCAKMLGVSYSGDSKEAFGAQMICFRVLSSLDSFSLKTWEDWKKASVQLPAIVERVLLLEQKVNIHAPDLIIPTILGSDDSDYKNQYLVRLYRWASIVAKADGTITEQEQQCLARLLQGANESEANEKKQQVRQDNSSAVAQPLSQEPSFDPYEELESLIGLESVKTEVKTFINFVKVQQARQAHGMKTSPVSYHCIFTGNPGTGKTTIARIIAAIYKDLGIIKGGQLVETDRSGLVGEYIGSTAIKTNKVIDKALDGVLFIDEAYALAEGGATDFGKEAIATLIKRMEDERERLVVILAGYPQNMTAFLNSNPGIQSRISRTIHFPDYSAQELAEIFFRCAEKYEYTLSIDGIVKLNEIISRECERKSVNFGNARFVRNLFERTIEHQANRLAGQSKINPKSLAEITGEDIY